MFNKKNVQNVEIYIPCNFQVYPITHFGVIDLFYQIFKILILFGLYFKKYKRQMLSRNCKSLQHVEIYIPCNCQVYTITNFGVIALFFQQIFKILILFVLYFKTYKRQMLSLITKMCSMSRSTYPAFVKYIPLPILELLPFFFNKFSKF